MIDNLLENKLRSMLCGVGISWGILILTLLLGVGKGFEEGVKKLFEGFAKNTMYVSSGSTSSLGGGSAIGRKVSFGKDDLLFLGKSIPSIIHISPEIGRLGIAKKGANSGSFTIKGVSEAYFNIRSVHLSNGRLINRMDLLKGRKVALIGSSVSKILFKQGKSIIGSYIEIDSENYKIVGIIRNSLLSALESSLIYVPFSSFQRQYNSTKNIGTIVLCHSDSNNSSEVEGWIRSIMAYRYKFNSKDDKALIFNNLTEQTKAVNGFFSGLKKFLLFIGISTLVSGVIGVTNMMFISAKERTKEIGLRKAVGAKRSSIIFMFFKESVVLTIFFGLLGMLLGIGFLKLIGYFSSSIVDNEIFDKPVLDLPVVIVSISLLVISGIVSAVFPAYYAASLSPIEALRAE
jgi:putative ABC transport system permease protein